MTQPPDSLFGAIIALIVGVAFALSGWKARTFRRTIFLTLGPPEREVTMIQRVCFLVAGLYLCGLAIYIFAERIK